MQICTSSGPVLISSVQAPFRLPRHYPENLLDRKTVNVVKTKVVKLAAAHVLHWMAKGGFVWMTKSLSINSTLLFFICEGGLL